MEQKNLRIWFRKKKETMYILPDHALLKYNFNFKGRKIKT